MGADLLLRGGLVVDGLGSAPACLDVGISDGRISSVGEEVDCRRVLDVDGLVVSPGFIDMHTHSDLALVEGGVLEMKLAQGVTLEVLGQDGLSCAPTTQERFELVGDLIAALNGETAEPWEWRTVGEYLERLDERVAQNVVYLVPHGTVRACVLGAEEREATPDEIEQMRRLVAHGLADGACGLSTGLSYPPAHASTTDEIVALAEVVAASGGIYVTHLRSYGDRLLEATDEALEIGQRANTPVHFSHFQAPGKRNHGLAQRLLGRLEKAREDELDVSFDVYPYEAASTMLTAFLPPPVRYLPRREAIEALRNDSVRDALTTQIDHGRPVGMDIEWSDLRIANGLDLLGGDEPGLVEVSRRRGETIGETVVSLLELTECRASVVAASTLESDVTACLVHPFATVGSDGLLVGDRPHPRAFGTFPRFLRRARASGLSLEEAVTAMTGRSAARLGLTDRGRITVGAAADLCVFDPERFVDLATYDDPTHLAEGMELVLVNGVAVWEDDHATGETPGQALQAKQGGAKQ